MISRDHERAMRKMREEAGGEGEGNWEREEIRRKYLGNHGIFF